MKKMKTFFSFYPLSIIVNNTSLDFGLMDGQKSNFKSRIFWEIVRGILKTTQLVKI